MRDPLKVDSTLSRAVKRLRDDGRARAPGHYDRTQMVSVRPLLLGSKPPIGVPAPQRLPAPVVEGMRRLASPLASAHVQERMR
jgi:hypothetical protein